MYNPVTKAAARFKVRSLEPHLHDQWVALHVLYWSDRPIERLFEISWCDEFACTEFRTYHQAVHFMHRCGKNHLQYKIVRV